MIPELRQSGPRVRLVPGRDIIITPRFRDIIDHECFQRLRDVRQLGPTHLVYPGAVHTRFEHSLGVMGYTAACINTLLQDPNLRNSVDEESILTALAAGLLHDVGHYPFAHSLEAVHLEGRDTPRHEKLGREIVVSELGAVLKKSLGVTPERVAELFSKPVASHAGIDALFASIISGAIDADKMDYLERDSAHLGVPYGRSFDIGRLLSSLRVDYSAERLAIDVKGKVPAEMFIFSRYMMFSEVYWHHTVRAASAMVEMALADYIDEFRPTLEELQSELLGHSDDNLLHLIASRSADESPSRVLITSLTSSKRRLFKRVATYSRSYAEDWKRAAYETLYMANTHKLAAIREQCARSLSGTLGHSVRTTDILIDTPPRDKDHHETIAIQFPNVIGQNSYPLHELSRVVSGVHDDFVAVVKKIRIFVAPHIAARVRNKQHESEHALARAILG